MNLQTRYTEKKLQVFKVVLSDYLPSFSLDRITEDFKVVGKLRYASLDSVLNMFKSDKFVTYDRLNDIVTFDFISLKSFEVEKRLHYISKAIWR